MKKNHKRVGIKDIAKQAGVSVGPVDKILNNRGGVSQKTKEKILKAIKDLNYKPNILASRLKSTKSYTIAVLMPKPSKEIPYWYQHKIGFKAVQEELDPYGFNLEVFYFSQNSESSFNTQTAKILKEDLDGIFMVPVFEEKTIKFLQECKKKKIPVIFFDSTFPGLDNLSFIGQDARDSGFIAADLLNRCISDNGALLTVTISKKDDNHVQFAKRKEGFKRFFEQHERRLICYENNTPDEVDVQAELRNILIKNKDIEGIFVTNGVAKVAAALDELHSNTKHRLLGYDLIKENVDLLNNGTIDFLISQQPHLQSYQGIKYFYDHLILKQNVNKEHFLPVTIVMKSTLKYQTFSP
ncbi:LacI family DNA-binding transcriptional regulator [Compostibacter hankyongensis]|uniref:Substrate-binding domain-containing protein n=1 Tax=Compostibacter hankyongensis TaxID=1007089 RepID=A0ABP8FR08_9BACT